MNHHVRCKRIIAGKTYNTDTSTLLGVYEDINKVMLFKTRHGAYFLYGDDSNKPEEWVTPIDPTKAQDWMERYCSAERVEAEFGEMPDAGDEEARFTLRIPKSFHKRIALIAEANDQSLNAWILRCLERCAS